MLNSLSQTLLKLTVPGVPDLYQGTEVWDLNLVDPDNRRPVDFTLRRRLLEALDSEIEATGDRAAFARALLDAWEDGRVKLYVIRHTLGFRRDHPALFQDGDYRPLELAGPLAAHACAFARTLRGEAVLTLVPRLLARRGLEGPPLGRVFWGDDTVVPVAGEIGRRFRNVLTGERLLVQDGVLGMAEVFQSFPVALLVREE
jgi:(1->4)-alpha-D-glucan 1-alpha-D-glucosylmutase